MQIRHGEMQVLQAQKTKIMIKANIDQINKFNE